MTAAIMLVSIDKRTGAYADILARRRFAINILPAEATGLADAFGGKTAAKGADRFEPGAWTTLSTGAPVLASALGVFDCEVEEVIDRGGVALVIGRVLALASKGEGAPLVAFRGQYRS
jgi:flavin reductase (DIM6/NTAB) family NADH-FMN oxidoreductase RutF